MALADLAGQVADARARLDVLETGEEDVTDVRAVSDAWAVGQAQVTGGETALIEQWNGSSWSIVPGAIGGTPGRAVAAISPTDVWALTDVGKHGGVSGVENWNGSQWNTVSLPTAEPLYGLSALSADDEWAVGSGGIILNWNGTQWSQIADLGGNESLAAVDVLSANDARTISYSGTLIEQWNGTSWNVVPTASGLPANYAEAGGFIWSGGSLYGVTGGPLFAVGGTDGGGSTTVVLEQPQA